MTKLFLKIIMPAVVAAGFYAWRVEGIQGAANLLHFTACVFGFVAIVGALMMKPGEIKTAPAGKLERTFNWCVDLGIVGAFAWVGDFTYAIIWLAAVFAVVGGGHVGRKPAPGATA